MVLTFSSSLSMIHSTYTCMTTALLVPLFPSIPSSLASSYAPCKSPAILPILLISLCSTDGSSIIEMVIQYDSPCLPDPPGKGGRPTPTPKSSGDYIWVSSTSSYAHSIVSSRFTLSSNTTNNSSTSSALFDRKPNSDDLITTRLYHPLQDTSMFHCVVQLHFTVQHH